MGARESQFGGHGFGYFYLTFHGFDHGSADRVAVLNGRLKTRDLKTRHPDSGG